jgi:predicted ATP-binding protein involved in virulence
LGWLSQLRFEELDGHLESGELLSYIKDFVNQDGFLPHGVKFETVTSKSVVFKNPEGIEIDVARLSDGFRSVLSMTFELIRQLFACYEKANLFDRRSDGTIRIMAPGIVMIDEIDAHLHPTWQRRIGFWLTTHFPELQFIVTTHSPLVCQAAEKGSVFRLPTPGSEQDEAGFVTGPALDRLIHGDVLDAYGTELFGKDIERSESTNEKLEELSLLNQKALLGKLSAAEAARHIELKRSFSAHLQSPF